MQGAEGVMGEKGRGYKDVFVAPGGEIVIRFPCLLLNHQTQVGVLMKGRLLNTALVTGACHIRKPGVFNY